MDSNLPDSIQPKPRNTIREWIEAAIIALLLALFIIFFVVQPFKIPSGSMIPTLMPGDRILVNKFIYGLKVPFTDQYIARLKKPQRGDIIVFKYPKDEAKDYIKRVIGVENDEVEIKNDMVYINSKKIETKYIEKHVEYNDESTRWLEYLGDDGHYILLKNTVEENYGPVTIPPHQLFVMGDNRDNSLDSRLWGFVDESKVRGKAFMIYFSWPDLKRCFQIIQ